MARIAGVKIQKSAGGKIKTITFDFKKYGEILNPILEELGIIEAKEEEDDFDREFKAGITKEELLKDVHAQGYRI